MLLVGVTIFIKPQGEALSGCELGSAFAEVVKMGDPAARASELMKKADKKLSGFGLFGGFGNRYEDAAEMYERAGNQFKLAKACKSYSTSQLSVHPGLIACSAQNIKRCIAALT